MANKAKIALSGVPSEKIDLTQVHPCAVVSFDLKYSGAPKTRTSAKIWPTLFLIEFFECEFLAWKLSNKVKLGKVNYPKSKLYSKI